MPRLHIDLQEGFQNDTIWIRVDGQIRWQKDDVNTRWQIGLADSVELEVPEGRVQVAVELPNRAVTDSIAFLVSAPVYLGVSVTPEGRLEFTVAQEPFRYL